MSRAQHVAASVAVGLCLAPVAVLLMPWAIRCVVVLAVLAGVL